MRNSVRAWGLVLLLGLLSGLPLQAGDVDLNSPLPVDAQIKMGTLPNGMSYWVRKHGTPPGKINMWLHVASGSLNEEENQRGLAHFLEHLAFDGSENFPPGTLIKYFESIGLRFGNDQNAFTGFDQTTYTLTLPDTQTATVSKGLQFLADVAFRLNLTGELIDKERAVILEETRARKGVGQRLTEKQLPILVPGSRMAERLPIGTEEVVKGAQAQQIKDYYKRWYRPDLTTLIFVGDIEVAEAEKLIGEAFKDWKAVEAKPLGAQTGIKNYTGARAATISDQEVADVTVSIINLASYQPRLTIADFRRDLVDGLATWIINQRLDHLVKSGQAPYTRAGVGLSPMFNACEAASGMATGKPEQWRAIVESLLSEVKRGRDFGFLEQELQNARNQTLAGAEQAARTEATRDARVFIGAMNQAITQGQKPMSAAQRLELLKALLPTVTLEEVAAEFKKHFAPQTRLILLTMPEKADLKLPSDGEILELAAKIEASRLEAPVARAKPKSLMEQEPTAGKVARREEDPDLKILSVSFDNGVRVHLRSMDFKKDQATVQITLAGSALRENAGNRGVSDIAGLAFAQTATQQLASTTIKDMFVGKNVSVSGGAGGDAFTLSVSGSPKDLEEGLRLAHLLLMQGKIEESAMKVWKQRTLEQLQEMRTDVEAQASEKVRRLLMNEDPRSPTITPEQVTALTLEAGQAWLEDALKNSSIEACIVGDIDRDQALQLAARYLGSLPARKPSDNSLKKLRKLALNKGPHQATLEVKTITADRAVVECGWRAADWRNVKDRRVMQLAAQILNSRLHEEIRIKRGLTYSVHCFNSPSREYERAGLFGIYFTADPDKSEEACQLAMDMVRQLAEHGPSDAEMETVRKQVHNQLETTLKEPSYWVGVLSDLDYRGTKLSDVKEVLSKMSTYSKEDIVKTLRKYIREEGEIKVIAKPKKN